MKLRELLDIRPGITTVIGSGGKTTMLRMLGEELAAENKRVILTTTTKIYPFADMLFVAGTDPSEIEQGFDKGLLLCCGTPLPDSGKLAAPANSIKELAELADYVIVEGDGSHCLPLKAHSAHEPVIPHESNKVICAVGLSGLGRPIREVCHRSELYAELAGKTIEDIVTPQIAADVLNKEHLTDLFFLNQADDPQRFEAGEEMGRLIHGTCCLGALQKGIWKCL